jgi:hypothetical protein
LHVLNARIVVDVRTIKQLARVGVCFDAAHEQAQATSRSICVVTSCKFIRPPPLFCVGGGGGGGGGGGNPGGGGSDGPYHGGGGSGLNLFDSDVLTNPPWLMNGGTHVSSYSRKSPPVAALVATIRSMKDLIYPFKSTRWTVEMVPACC